jgi:hypothetical protein
MKRKRADGGVTLVEALIGLVIFVSIAIPLIRYAASSANSGKVIDLKIASAILHGECAVMYKNQKLPLPQRFVTINNAVFEISSTAEKDSVMANWSITVKKAGKSIAGVHGLLYLPSVIR